MGASKVFSTFPPSASVCFVTEAEHALLNLQITDKGNQTSDFDRRMRSIEMFIGDISRKRRDLTSRFLDIDVHISEILLDLLNDVVAIEGGVQLEPRNQSRLQ
ncbi:hypothetical protein PINS_up022213 [Pythium insidiosum]|nr:hypothetical protein PINS_up022213 [Pythium insidiosum]